MLRKFFIDVTILYQKRISISEKNFNFKTSFIILDIRNYPCPQCGKKMKLTSGLTRHLNACISLLLCIQLDRNTPMLAEDNDVSDHFMHYKKEEYPLGNEGQEIKEDQRDLVGQGSDNKSLRDMLPGRTPQVGLLGSESSSFLREIRFSN